ncbi:MAG: mitochondrial fission ELM1 family protein [Pseudomonadota bacterium]
MDEAQEPRRGWIITDGARGNEKQCLALAHYLIRQGVIEPSPQQFRIALRQPWDALAPRLRAGVSWALKPAANHPALTDARPVSTLLAEPPPALILSCGRRAALLALHLRRAGNGRTRTVHILNPRIAPDSFDHVICPRHDGLTGDNVINTLGALHLVDDDTLRTGKADWPEFGEHPSPRVAVLIGASNRAYQITPAYVSTLLNAAAALAGAAGSLLVTTSRRTPPALVQHARSITQGAGTAGCAFFADQPGLENPYPGFLAWADRLVVSSDSVNMISEALGTGRPVHVPLEQTGNQRFQRFREELLQRGYLQGLEVSKGVASDYPALRETGQVAQQLTAALAPAGQ